MTTRSDYAEFMTRSTQTRRLLRQEELILEATEGLVEAIDAQGLSRSELARRIGKSKAFVSQALSGRRNMTLRTLADLGDAVGTRVWLRFSWSSEARGIYSFRPAQLASSWALPPKAKTFSILPGDDLSRVIATSEDVAA